MPDISRVRSLTALRSNCGSAGRINKGLLISTRSRSTLNSCAGLISGGSVQIKNTQDMLLSVEEHLDSSVTSSTFTADNNPGENHVRGDEEEGVAADIEKARCVRPPAYFGRHRSCPASPARSNRSSVAESSNPRLPCGSADIVESRHDISTLAGNNNDALDTIFTIYPEEEAQCQLEQERIEGVEVSLLALPESSGAPPGAIADKNPDIEKPSTLSKSRSAPPGAIADGNPDIEKPSMLSRSRSAHPGAIAGENPDIETPPTVQFAPSDARDERDLAKHPTVQFAPSDARDEQDEAHEECASTTMDDELDVPTRLTPIIISGMRTNSMTSIFSDGGASAITVKVSNNSGGTESHGPVSLGKSAYASAEPVSGTRRLHRAFRVVANFVTEKLDFPNTKCHLISEESTYADDEDVDNLVFM